MTLCRRSQLNIICYQLAGAQAPPEDPVRQRAPEVAVRALQVERRVQQRGWELIRGFLIWRQIQICFLIQAVVILAQHANQGKLTGAETALARWLVYVHTHCDLPLDYR